MKCARLCSLVLSLGLLLLGLEPLAAQSRPLPAPLAQSFREAGVPPGSVALLVREVGRERTLIEHRSRVPMNPASTMKILATAMALEVLGRDYTWKTEVLSAAPVIDGVLTGPLVFRGSGDPKFTWEHLAEIVKALRAQGIRDLAGDVLIDRSLFGPIPDLAERFDGQTLRPYNVAPDALLFNHKAVGFRFTPQPDGSVQVATDGPTPDGLTIQSRLRAVPGPCGDWRAKIESRFDSGPNMARALFSGGYPSECGEREWWVSLFDHNGLFAGMFARLWRDAGGLWTGIVRDGKAPARARLLYRHVSAPLTQAILDINKFSNNVMTRQVMLTIDAQLHGAPARVERLSSMARQWLSRQGIEAPELVVENGAGLSRIERISADSLARLLELGVTASWAQDFIASLPIAGSDGTLSQRFTQSPAQGRAFLKTGTLAGVKALAGYLIRADGVKLIFVCLVNHPNAEAAVPVMDQAVEWALGAGIHIQRPRVR